MKLPYLDTVKKELVHSHTGIYITGILKFTKKVPSCALPKLKNSTKNQKASTHYSCSSWQSPSVKEGRVPYEYHTHTQHEAERTRGRERTECPSFEKGDCQQSSTPKNKIQQKHFSKLNKIGPGPFLALAPWLGLADLGPIFKILIFTRIRQYK